MSASLVHSVTVAENKRVTTREWLIAITGAVILILIMLVPYALGYLLTGPDTVFTGIIMNSEDSQTYFAKMLQGYDGQWLYHIPFTAEEHEPVFLGGIYLALGQLARVSGLTVEVMWHGARVVADLLMFLTTYWFIASFIERREWRVVAYLLALFGSGLGWVLFLLNQPY